jgi:hypothetical protein
MPELTLTELSIIKNMMLSKSHKYISDLLGHPILEIKNCIKELTAPGVVTYQDKLDAAKRNRVSTKPLKIKAIPVKKVIVKHQVETTINQRQKNKDERLFIERQREGERKRSRATIPTRIIDYSKLVKVIIDKKTCIYVKPGQEETGREEFLAREQRKKNKYEQ